MIHTRNSGWYTVGADSHSYPFPAPFNQEFHIILNLAIGGHFDEWKEPLSGWTSGDMKVDYVRVYKWDDNLTKPQMPSSVTTVKEEASGIEITQSENEIYVSSKEDIQSVTLYSISGQLVHVQTNTIVQTAGFTRGIYILKVATINGNQKTFKNIL